MPTLQLKIHNGVGIDKIARGFSSVAISVTLGNFVEFTSWRRVEDPDWQHMLYLPINEEDIYNSLDGNLHILFDLWGRSQDKESQIDKASLMLPMLEASVPITDTIDFKRQSHVIVELCAMDFDTTLSNVTILNDEKGFKNDGFGTLNVKVQRLATERVDYEGSGIPITIKMGHESRQTIVYPGQKVYHRDEESTFKVPLDGRGQPLETFVEIHVNSANGKVIKFDIRNLCKGVPRNEMVSLPNGDRLYLELLSVDFGLLLTGPRLNNDEEMDRMYNNRMNQSNDQPEFLGQLRVQVVRGTVLNIRSSQPKYLMLVLSVRDEVQSTMSKPSPHPVWDEVFLFPIYQYRGRMDSLLIELFDTDTSWGQKTRVCQSWIHLDDLNYHSVKAVTVDIHPEGKIYLELGPILPSTNRRQPPNNNSPPSDKLHPNKTAPVVAPPTHVVNNYRPQSNEIPEPDNRRLFQNTRTSKQWEINNIQLLDMNDGGYDGLSILLSLSGCTQKLRYKQLPDPYWDERLVFPFIQDYGPPILKVEVFSKEGNRTIGKGEVDLQNVILGSTRTMEINIRNGRIILEVSQHSPNHIRLYSEADTIEYGSLQISIINAILSSYTHEDPSVTVKLSAAGHTYQTQPLPPPRPVWNDSVMFYVPIRNTARGALCNEILQVELTDVLGVVLSSCSFPLGDLKRAVHQPNDIPIHSGGHISVDLMACDFGYPPCFTSSLPKPLRIPPTILYTEPITNTKITANVEHLINISDSPKPSSPKRRSPTPSLIGDVNPMPPLAHPTANTNTFTHSTKIYHSTAGWNSPVPSPVSLNPTSFSPVFSPSHLNFDKYFPSQTSPNLHKPKTQSPEVSQLDLQLRAAIEQLQEENAELEKLNQRERITLNSLSTALNTSP